MRLLLTGAGGFVAPYVARAARAAFGADLVMAGAAKVAAVHPDIGAIHAMELSSTASVRAAVSAFRPTHVIHLGAISAFAAAGDDYEQAWNVNVLGALRCAHALRDVTPGGVFVFVGSAQIYGDAGRGESLLSETSPQAPAGDYATTKAAADLAVAGMSRRGLKVIRFRPFNHTGPAQSETFVVPRFAAQIARIEAGRQAPTMLVGNLAARRDFLDVRDVARAYVQALVRADDLGADAVFNLASGRAESIRWILDHLVGLSRVPVAVETDPSLWRPDEGSVLIGDASKAAQQLGWRPEIPLETTLHDVLEHCRANTA